MVEDTAGGLPILRETAVLHKEPETRLSRGRRSVLISFSGVDGSGKSTQVKLLQERLAGMHIESRRVWCRWRPITSLPLLMILRRMGYAKVHHTSSIGFVETKIPPNGLSSLWAFLTQLDNLLKTGPMILIPLMLRKTVICDRYVLDLMVEGSADLGRSGRVATLGFKFLKVLPRPRQAFLVLVEPSVAFQRKPDMPTIAHFKARTELYKELAGSLGVTVLDGSQSPERIHDQIWSRVAGIFVR